jgi:hypothetical protein
VDVLASERELRCARDATDVVMALGLLPGDEAREPLRKLVRRVNALLPSADGKLRARTWNVLCTAAHLVELLDEDVVGAALADQNLDTTNRVLLLRAHPDADHAIAERMWQQANLAPLFARDVLRATGPRQRDLAREAVDAAGGATTSSSQAARLAAAISLAPNARLPRMKLVSIATDAAQPATVRAVAAWISKCDLAAGEDPAWDRYVTWRRSRAQQVPDPLIDLLSGAWQAQVLA